MRKKSMKIVTIATAALTAIATPAATAANNCDTKIQATAISPDQAGMESDFDSLIATVDQYVITEDGKSQFDAESAEADGASGFLLEVGHYFNELSNQQEGGRETSFRSIGYGNWCGPGHSGPDAPINTLDSICMRHDKCYAEKGYFACSCDRALIDDIKRNRGNFHGAGENAMTVAVASYFNSNLCNPFK